MRKFITLIIAGLLALMSAVALAATTTTYSQKFTTTHPNRATGMTLKWSTKVQPKTVTITFPANFPINPPKAGTKVGSGTATFSKGTPPRPVIAYSTGPGGMRLDVLNSVGVKYTMNVPFVHMGSQMVIHVPAFKIPRATLTGLSVTFKGGTAKRPFLLTPPYAKGGWKFTAAFAYPGRTEVLHSTSACVKH
jgi:hypothetical protein